MILNPGNFQMLILDSMDKHTGHPTIHCTKNEVLQLGFLHFLCSDPNYQQWSDAN